MGKDRILGSAAKIEIFKASGGVMAIEVDSFSATQKHDQKQWHPLGQIGERQQLIYKGWDLDFKTGKIDDQVSAFFDTIDVALLAGQPAPRVRVVETIKHFDGNNETWVYTDVVLSGYKKDASTSDDEIKEEFKGSCTLRIKG